MSSQKTKPKTLDLNHVKKIIFANIDLILDSFGLEYTQDGDNIFMSCPIHEGSDNPNALSISLDKQMWRCWTRGCQEEFGTDIFAFVRGVLQSRDEPSSFSDALRYICKIYNVDNAKSSKVKKTVVPEDDFVSLVNNFKTKDWQDNTACEFDCVPTIGHSPYFESRGFNRNTLKHFGVEDCSNNDSPMRHRSIIPIRYNESQVGYIARATNNWLQPKYLFSEGIRKTDYLYNYDEAIKAAKSKHCLFLVEGQGDVWKLFEAGVRNAAGLFGKDISDKQKSLILQAGVTKLIIITDNDQAGRESKIKINRDLNRLFSLSFPRIRSNDLGVMSIDSIKEQILSNLNGCY